MEFRVEHTDSAEMELAQGFDWVLQRSQSRAVAERWAKSLVEAIESLSRNPKRCPLAPENESFAEEVRQLLHGRGRGQRRIVFTIEEDVVKVLHVRHASRDSADD
jgi:plasmid stabilization system protein ParE